VDARDKRGHDGGKAGMPPLNKLSATEIAQGIAAGKFTAEAVTRDCLERIKTHEPTVQAWATVDPDHALK
jgi:Asp-tRNA(Asn)/Glu-tRNA(Gln) amidotransferase A subunit family amidase